SKHDWQITSQRAHSRHTDGAANHNDVRSKSHQFRCVFSLEVDFVLSPANSNLHVAAITPAEVLHGSFECYKSRLTFRIICGPVHEDSHPAHALWLLSS